MVHLSGLATGSPNRRENGRIARIVRLDLRSLFPRVQCMSMSIFSW
jgi:hypothetical protein